MEKGVKMRKIKTRIIQIKIKKRIIKDDTRAGAMFCFKNCEVNIN